MPTRLTLLGFLALAACAAPPPARPVSGPFPQTAFDRWLLERFWEEHPEALCDPEPQLDDGALWRCPEGTPSSHFRSVL